MLSRFLCIIGLSLSVLHCASGSPSDADAHLRFVEPGKANCSGICPESCGTARELCDGACVATASDPEHCGACGVLCAPGQYCSEGACVEACAQSLCASARGADCANLLSNPDYCGSCSTSCALDQACEAGACVTACGLSEERCNGQCVNVVEDANHCGGCGAVCPATTSCQGGQCVCAAGGVACGAECVDLAANVRHCGACGLACVGGQACVQGACQCPLGTTLCGDTCVDPLTTAEHCGACGSACGAEEHCAAGECVGEDGCFALPAHSVAIEEVALYQAVKVPLSDGGVPIPAAGRNADIVQGKDGVLRVFVSLGPSFSPREVSARLYLSVNDGAEELLFSRQTVSRSSIDEDATSTFNIEIPGAALLPNQQYRVELVECTQAVGEALGARFPELGEAPLAVRQVGGLKLHFVPIQVGSQAPDVSPAALRVYEDLIRAMYPISELTTTVGPVLSFSGFIGIDQALDAVRAQRETDRPEDDVFYYGLFKPTATFGEYCGGGCATGVGYVTDSLFAPLQVAVGVAYGGEQSAMTMAHEVGHNHGREHAPCGGASGVDPGFPYSDARLGVWGYDARGQTLLPPDGADIMSYCDEQWVSDYTYQEILERIAAVNGGLSPRLSGGGAELSTFWTLNIDSRGARFSEPLRSRGVPPLPTVQLTALDAAGTPIAQVTGYSAPIEGAPAELILVPEPEPGWAAVSVPSVLAGSTQVVPF